MLSDQDVFIVRELKVIMSNPPYSSLGVKIAAILALWSALLIGVFVTWTWSIPAALVVSMFGIKLFGARRIPWSQVLLASVLLAGMHFLIEEAAIHSGLPPIIKIGELLFPIVCVFGFGRHWVKQGYIPREANRWASE